jgi:predicted amidophosphoribosyltransferase
MTDNLTIQDFTLSADAQLANAKKQMERDWPVCAGCKRKVHPEEHHALTGYCPACFADFDLEAIKYPENVPHWPGSDATPG